MYAFCIAYVSTDSKRRNLPGRELKAWVILSVVVPYLGVLAYLFSRSLDRFFSMEDRESDNLKKRITMAMHLPVIERKMPTMPVGELVRQNVRPQEPVEYASPGYALQVTDGPHKGQEFKLYSLPASIGRGAEATCRLDSDRGVSRRHAEIYEQSGMLRIRDLRSTHGTFVNGFSIDDKSLDFGDMIRVGDSVLMIGPDRSRP
jgi:hypothetical protein